MPFNFMIMKKTFNKFTIVLILLSTAIGSCKKFGDTNIDPTRSSSLDPSLQLSSVQLRFSGDLGINETLGLSMTMPLVQQLGGTWLNRNGQKYIKNTTYLYFLWDNTYPTDILNIVDAINRTTGVAKQTNLNAVLRIMKVYSFARLTDLYGDIPYSEAGKGFIDGVNRPKFDKQEDIYNDFFKELKECSAHLDASKDAVKGDLFYNGNISSWKKFANSLHLRLAMRLVKINPAKAQEEVTAAFNAGVFTSNEDICMIKHLNIQNTYDDGRGNGVSGAFTQLEVPPRVTNTFIGKLRDTNDPRLTRMIKYYIDVNNKTFERLDITDELVPLIGYNGVSAKGYIWDDWMNTITITVPGVGEVAAENNDQKAQLANFMIRNDAPFLHLTYAEVELLLADFNFRFNKSLGGTVAEHYVKGMDAAIKQISLFPTAPTIPQDEINTFIRGNSLVPGRELDMINTQLWIALLMNGPEAYANWRRTGYPVLVPSVTAESNSTTIPRRFEYPLSELEQNSVNLKQAVAGLGGVDDWNKRVWWDK